MKDSFNKMRTLCHEIIVELSQTVILGAEMGKTEVDSHVLLKLIEDSNAKMKVINQQYQEELAADIAKIVGEIDELKTHIRKRTRTTKPAIKDEGEQP